MTTSPPPRVSVIVPTTGRPSLTVAVESVLRQTMRELEVLVVVDGPARPVPVPASSRVRVLATGAPGGPGPARQAGIAAARAPYVAFLDDDDRWLPQKLEMQLALVEGGTDRRIPVIASSRVLVVDPDGRTQLVAPRRLIGPRESLADYLFRRRSVRWGESLLHPSTLLCSRDLAAAVPWSGGSMHEDWGWLLDVARGRELEVVMVEEPLVAVTETPRSASRSGQWEASLRWVTSRRTPLARRHRGDVLLCTTAPYAKAAAGRRGALRIGWTALRSERPGLPALVFFCLTTLGPTELLTRLARLTAGRPAP